MSAAAQIFEFFPDRCYGHLKIMAAFNNRSFPYLIIELFIGKHLARIARHKSKDIELQRRKISRLFTVGDESAVHINGESPILQGSGEKYSLVSAGSRFNTQFQFKGGVGL